jgi:hypothetical protein
LKLALEALEGIHPGNMTPMAEEYWNKAITAIKQALAAPVQEPLQPVWNNLPSNKDVEDAMRIKRLNQLTTPPAAPDLQAELDATNRQVEILSDALAESRREIDALVALARADEREACAKVCDAFQARDVGMQPAECAGAIRARSNT